MSNEHRSLHSSRFNRNDCVIIDGDKSIVATVIGHMFNQEGCEVRCSWFAHGVLQEPWIAEDRLTLGEGK